MIKHDDRFIIFKLQNGTFSPHQFNTFRQTHIVYKEEKAFVIDCGESQNIDDDIIFMLLILNKRNNRKDNNVRIVNACTYIRKTLSAYRLCNLLEEEETEQSEDEGLLQSATVAQ